MGSFHSIFALCPTFVQAGRIANCDLVLRSGSSYNCSSDPGSRASSKNLAWHNSSPHKIMASLRSDLMVILRAYFSIFFIFLGPS
jgi:hypothetical protein